MSMQTLLSKDNNFVQAVVIIVEAGVNSVFHVLCARHCATCFISCYLVVKESVAFDCFPYKDDKHLATCLGLPS